MFPIPITNMRSTVPEWYNDVYAVCKLEYEWLSFVGKTMSSHPDYHKGEQRVRQLFSPKQLADPDWIAFLDKHDARPATGEEPLAYTYGSSGCSAAIVPDVIDGDCAYKLSKFVHDAVEERGKVPHDIGLHLAEIVREHLRKALD